MRPRHPVSVKHVAARAGVAVGTVSNVLNKPDKVSMGTRARVLAAIDELGFVRNEAARQLRAGLSSYVGLVVLNSNNPFYNDVAEGAEDAAAARGLSVLVGNSADRPEREDAHLRLFEQQRVRGVLVVSPAGAIKPELDRLRSRGIAGAVVGADETGGAYSSVSVDDITGGALAIRHLAGLGHKQIALVGASASGRPATSRFHGAEEEASRHAGVTVRHVPTTARTTEAGLATGLEILRRPRAEQPTALFAVNDLVALGLLQAMAARGVRVPEEVALIGYDDISFAAGAAIPLSSIAQPRHEIGRRAMEVLLATADDPDRPTERVLLQPALVIRQSTDPAAALAPGFTPGLSP